MRRKPAAHEKAVALGVGDTGFEVNAYAAPPNLFRRAPYAFPIGYLVSALSLLLGCGSGGLESDRALSAAPREVLDSGVTDEAPAEEPPDDLADDDATAEPAPVADAGTTGEIPAVDPDSDDQAAFHVPVASVASTVDSFAMSGFGVVYVDGYTVGTDTFFNLLFRRDTPPAVLFTNLTLDELAAEDETQQSMMHLDAYSTPDGVRFAAVWHTLEIPLVYEWYANTSSENHQAQFAAFATRDIQLTSLSAIEEADGRRVTALYVSPATSPVSWVYGMRQQDYSTINPEEEASLRFVTHIDVSRTTTGTPLFSGIWEEGAAQGRMVELDLSRSDLDSALAAASSAGLRLLSVSGYEAAGEPRFAFIAGPAAPEEAPPAPERSGGS